MRFITSVFGRCVAQRVLLYTRVPGISDPSYKKKKCYLNVFPLVTFSILCLLNLCLMREKYDLGGSIPLPLRRVLLCAPREAEETAQEPCGAMRCHLKNTLAVFHLTLCPGRFHVG